MKKIRMALLGCGDRGNVYASYALKHPEEAEIVAVTDIDSIALKVTGDAYALPQNKRFSSLDDFLAANVACDTVINATMDEAHYETAKKLINAGYNQLLEKPIVNNEKDLLELKNLAAAKGVSVVVCHVLRYTPFYRTMKGLINAGKIGKILTLEMNEHVGTVHFADSFVRGKWADEDDCGSGLLLQKCCHDMDLMCWLNNFSAPDEVTSFAKRANFIEENAPEGATEFCYQCPHNQTCLYDAKKIHLELDWFYFQTWRGINKPLAEITKEEKEDYLKRSDYGRCVYKLKRNLMDRQMVTVLFKDGSMGSLNVVGGCSVAGREIKIVGTKGEIKGRLEDNKFKLYEYIHNGETYKAQSTEVDVSDKVGADARHSNGDMCLMYDYVRFLNGDESSVSMTSINDSVNGHKCVYAAEQSRKEKRIVSIGK
nr:Gfo/Idh/MocA family oxidoreductase [Clostridia bacterium]MDY6222760.1 Gfo/Idh/MocA family oxidoreductase [Christensenellaceae bacterium]